MTDVLAIVVVIIIAIGVTALWAPTFERSMRSLVWLALLEYLTCSAMQMVYTRVFVRGGDMLVYADGGAQLARALDQSFKLAAPELLNLLLQKDSAFDYMIEGAGGNTGSMFAIAAFLEFALRGSVYAIHVLIAALSFFGSLSIFKSFRDAYAGGSTRRVFVATVLFPSIAFWSSALVKEAFCIMGMGAVLAAWRGVYRRRWAHVVIWGPIGAFLMVIFRAPAIPPLTLGIGLFFLYDRFAKMRQADSLVLTPVYVVAAFGFMAGVMVLLSAAVPSLALGQLVDSVSHQQGEWIGHSGGSAIDGDVSVTAGAQLTHIPIALVNSLFRPQIFDVHNFGTLISAIEMTTVTILLLRTFWVRGVSAVFTQIQRSPFLVMCAVVAFVGCAFVGLVTYNLGSLARYRVPFLPFYGTLIAVLSDRSMVAPAATRRLYGPLRRATARIPRVSRRKAAP